MIRASLSLLALVALSSCDTSAKSGSSTTALAPNQVVQTVRWPSLAALDSAALAKLPPEARAKVESAKMPVLVPNDVVLLEHAKIVAEQNFFAFSASSGGLSVSVHGTRVAHVRDIPPIKGDRTIRGASAFVTENERVREASWTENGVSYVVDVECEKENDARCSSDRFLVR